MQLENVSCQHATCRAGPSWIPSCVTTLLVLVMTFRNVMIDYHCEITTGVADEDVVI